MGSVESYPTTAGKRYRVRYRTPDRRDTQKRGFRTKREAEDYLSSVEVAKLRGEWVDASRSRITVGEWSQQWLAAQVQLKPTTLSGYRHALEKHIVPRWGRTRLVDVAHSDVQTRVTTLSTTLGPSAVRQTHLALSGVMKFAIRDGRLARNPCDDVRLPRLVKRRHGYLSHERVAALVAELGDQGDVALFLAYTGLRWGEMAGLRVGRLDMAKRRLEVVEAVSEPRGQLVFGTPKTHEHRSVPFPSLLTEPLAGRCAGKSRDDLVFTGADGGVLRGTNFRPRYFDPAIQRLQHEDPEFPRITMHDLRHTAASLAISAGANVKAVQRMLGHASAAMTLDVYADLFDDDLDSVASALDRSARKAALATPWPHGRGQQPPSPNNPTLFD